jgi:Protein of unknown function (DUF4242)
MPTFIDRHRAATVSREVRRQLTHEARAHERDVHGVRPIGHWLEDGWLYCVLEAPSVAAVRQHHDAHGLASDTARELDGVDGGRPIAAEDNQRVRAAINTYWSTLEA